MTGSGYQLDQEAASAAARFEAFGRIYDPVTLRHVDALGIRDGWRCWEIGAGGPSLPQALADRVGQSGYVLATDLRTQVLDAAGMGDVEVRRHDVARDPLPDGEFDLIHARLVLGHLPDGGQTLGRLASCLGPGGWLLVEDADPALQPLVCPDVVGADQELANKVKDAFRSWLAARSSDRAFGRTLPRLMRDAGLTDVAADAYFPVAMPESAVLEALTVSQVRDDLIAAGHVSAEDVAAYLELLDAGALDVAMPPLISARGRRP